MKKVLALALAICLVASIFVGCGKKEEETTTAAETQSSTTKQETTQETTQAQGKIDFNGKVTIEEKNGEKLEFDLPISVKDLAKLGTIDFTDPNEKLKPESGLTAGGILKWKDYLIELQLINHQEKAVALKDTEVEGVSVTIQTDDAKQQDLSVCGYSFSMTQEDVVAQCGEPTNTEKEEDNGEKYTAYEYINGDIVVSFDFENDKLCTIYVGVQTRSE